MDAPGEIVTSTARLIVDLIQAAAWPAVTIGIIASFRIPLHRFLTNISELSFKAGGFEATARRASIEAAAALGAATVKTAGPPSGDIDEARADRIASIVTHVADNRGARRLIGANVLWVDDIPDNNIWERKAMEALGIRFDLSKSTDEALVQVDRRSYDLIVSDMGRPPDARAGYTLLDALKARGYSKPFVIYSGSRSADHRAEAKMRGAVDCTNDPQELFELVTTSLVR